MKKSTIAGAAGILAGTLALAGVAGAALADTPVDDDTVAVNVAIEPAEVPGALAMSVASNSTTLTEAGSSAVQRTFTGELPTVTVTDTRDPATLDADAYWAVTGSVGDFAGDAGQQPIPGKNLGWTPVMVDAGDLGLVAEGDAVPPAPEDGGEGLATAGELLAISPWAQVASPDGQWSAKAALKLATAADVAPGRYSATLTLTLIE